MLKNTFTIIILLLSTSLYSQHRAVSIETPESVTEQSNPINIHFTPSALLDTTGAIPTLTQFYDYVTNGNNLRKLHVLGDTIIAAADFTDSLNASTSNARRTKYNVSFDGGQTWSSQPTEVSGQYTAYPDVVPHFLTGQRTISISGRGFNTGHGYMGTDIILQAGSFITNSLSNHAFYGAIVSSKISGNLVNCVYSSNDSLFSRIYNPATNTFNAPVFISLFPNQSRYYTASNSAGTHVFVMWWDAALRYMKYRESTNSGNTFGTAATIFTDDFSVNGNTVCSWFPADIAYRPGTNTPYVVMSSADLLGNVSRTGSKILMWSPSINGGTPVRVADFQNMPGTFLADPNFDFRFDILRIQQGLTPLSHPSIAFSNDGSVAACVFSVVRADTASYGFFYNSVYGSYSTNNGLTWSDPHPVSCAVPDNSNTAGNRDEIYPSLSKTGNTNDVFHLTYSLSECPGSVSFNNTWTPRCRVYQVYAKYCLNSFTGIGQINSEVPDEYSLEQNYPNPFNPATRIIFQITKASNVRLSVYDASGREVRNLVERTLNAGKYSVQFDAAGLSSGVYFYSIIAGDFAMTKKMILLK